jgi:integrase
MRTKHKPRGRHPQQRLTAVSVRNTRRPGRYADGNGLYLVVDPSGAKRWIWRGRIQGKRCDLGLGGVQIVSLAEARDQAVSYRRQARDGTNPRVERARALRVVPTFKAAAIHVHAEHKKTFKNPKHAAQWLQSLENDVFPILGPRLVDTIDTGDVLTVLTPIWTEKPETARRLKQRMQLIFDWAKASGHRDGKDNPIDGLKEVLPKHKGDKQHHAALRYQDVPSFVTTLQAIPDMQDAVRLGLEFLILTATRTNEVQCAVWSEINLETKTWTIPGARTKSGREHRVPLSDRAVAILERAQALDGAYVFPGTKAGRPLSNMTFLKAVRRLTHDDEKPDDEQRDVTTHGFRSSFRDWCEERTNVSRTVSEAALAHVVEDKTEAAYRRGDLFDKRRTLMATWAAFVTSTPADVVTISA